jgi:hypothetical protein
MAENMYPESHISDNERGYALLTVMVISLIIVVVTMSITSTVRENIRVAIELNDKNMANLASYSAMNEVIYNILISTSTPYDMRIHKNDGSTEEWNLYGKPLELKKGITVRFRDIGGMVSPLFDPKELRELIEYISKDSEKSGRFFDSLSDWQDRDDLKRLNGAESYDYRAAGFSYSPRNFFLQVPEELKLIKGFDPSIYQSIKEDLVYWSGGKRNYLTMSEQTLKALLKNDPLVDTVIDLREKGELTKRIFRDLTGLPSAEETSLAPSGLIKVEITAEKGKAVDRIEAVIAKRQTSNRPFFVAEWRR